MLAFGLAGSDALNENPNPNVMTTSLMPVLNEAGQPLRFALATRDTAQDMMMVRSKITNNEPLKIATSFPNTAVRELARLGIWGVVSAANIEQGCVEGLLAERTATVDAIFEVVQSGNSVRQNGLVVLEDNIMPVMLMKVDRLAPEKGTL